MENKITKALSLAILLSVLFPQKSYSSPLSDEGSWKAHSVYESIIRSAQSLGIGGLQSEIKFDKEFKLKASDISYNNGYLYAKYDNQKLAVKVDPKIVSEAIKIVENNDIFSFQASIDITAVGRNEYVDPILRGTKIGQYFISADKNFASIVSGLVPPPEPQVVLPHQQASRLLENDTSYKKLAAQWEFAPKSWPQIYLYFNPNTEGLVDIEYKPQILFEDISGIALEVDDNSKKLGESPYRPLISDVNKRPIEYRKISQPINFAASITATLGILEAACTEIQSCIHLTTDSQKYATEIPPESEITDEQFKSQIEANFDLQNSWYLVGNQEFIHSREISGTDKDWAFAYDALQRAILQRTYIEGQELSIKKLSIKGDNPNRENQIRMLKKDIQKLIEIAESQFLHSQTPDDSLLLAAKAVISAWNGNNEVSDQYFDKALNLSRKFPKDRLQVLKMSSFISKLPQYDGHEESKINWRQILKLTDNAKIDAYDAIDKYLEACMSPRAKCLEQDVREWEATAFKVGLFSQGDSLGGIAWHDRYNRDLSWLHGRFAYLVGIQLDNEVQQRDRLRFLSKYTNISTGNHRQELKKLELDFKARLGITTSFDVPESSDTSPAYWLGIIYLIIILFFIKYNSRRRRSKVKRRLEDIFRRW